METMTLKTAAALYDVRLSTLRLKCTKGEIHSIKPSKHRYVTPAEMDRVFKGVDSKASGAKVLSR